MAVGGSRKLFQRSSRKARSLRMAAVGAGSSSKEELAEGEIAANGGGGEGSSSKPEKEVLGCWWCGDKGCTYREPASGELVCQRSEEYGDHPQFQDVKLHGSPLYAQLRARGESSLGFGKNSDGSSFFHVEDGLRRAEEIRRPA